MTDYETCSCEL